MKLPSLLISCLVLMKVKKNFSWCLSFRSRGFLCLFRLYFFLLKEKGILPGVTAKINREDRQLNQGGGQKHEWAFLTWEPHLASSSIEAATVTTHHLLESTAKVFGSLAPILQSPLAFSLSPTHLAPPLLYHPLISRLLPKYYQAFCVSATTVLESPNIACFLMTFTIPILLQPGFHPNQSQKILCPRSLMTLTSKSKILFKILILLNPLNLISKHL